MTDSRRKYAVERLRRLSFKLQLLEGMARDESVTKQIASTKQSIKRWKKELSL